MSAGRAGNQATDRPAGQRSGLHAIRGPAAETPVLLRGHAGLFAEGVDEVAGGAVSAFDGDFADGAVAFLQQGGAGRDAEPVQVGVGGVPANRSNSS